MVQAICCVAASLVKFDGNENSDVVMCFLTRRKHSDEPRCQDRTIGGMLGRVAGVYYCCGMVQMNEALGHI